MKLEMPHIRALKGTRQVTGLNVTGPDRARAAEAAGIDIVDSGRLDRRAAIRAAAPATHFCLGLIYGHQANRDRALRAAFDALEAGADSIYCCLSPRIIEGLAREGVPVAGHVGLVPQKARLTGFRAFGKSLAEAQRPGSDVRDLERAGADFASEHARLQDRRVAAFAACRSAVPDGSYPATPEIVAGDPDGTEAFRAWLDGLPP